MPQNRPLPDNRATDTLALSIVITIVSGARHLEDCLRALLDQEDCDRDGIEIIVPFDEQDQDICSLAPGFPEVIFHATRMTVDAPAWLSHEHFDELRSVGLQLARGRIIALLVDHETPARDWCSNMLKAHTLPHAAIGGAVENRIDRPINWATYFFDFGRYQNPVISGASHFLTDVNIAYKRPALDSIRRVWKHRFHEPHVHGALLANGETLWLSPEIIVYQNRLELTFTDVIRERLVWGRYFAGNRVAGKGLPWRATYCILSPAVPFIILGKMVFNIVKKRRLAGKFIQVLPYSLLLTLAWSWGEFTGYLTGRPSAFKPARYR